MTRKEYKELVEDLALMTISADCACDEDKAQRIERQIARYEQYYPTIADDVSEAILAIVCGF